MFFGSDFFWLLMGVILVLVAMAFKAFAEDQGWRLTWWKWLLAILWYGLVSLSFFTYGTLAGENEGSAGLKLMVLMLFISLILGVGLWRLLSTGRTESKPEATVKA
ncbi:MAG: hypothetical protein LC121_07075 [Anaerolineae bacterium]|jgi:4-amino-4-deoxy-L-arabinose transferase-like glycosyltransferase|nr:hypothetical protein [Anaerolineae bacterium]